MSGEWDTDKDDCTWRLMLLAKDSPFQGKRRQTIDTSGLGSRFGGGLEQTYRSITSLG